MNTQRVPPVSVHTALGPHSAGSRGRCCTAAWEIHTSTACQSALANITAYLHSVMCNPTGLTHSHPLTQKKLDQEVTANYDHQGEGGQCEKGLDMNSSTPFMSWKIRSHRERQCHGNKLWIQMHIKFFSVLVFLDVNQTNEIPPLPNIIMLWGKRNWFAIFHNNAFPLLVFVAHKLTLQLKYFAWIVSLHCIFFLNSKLSWVFVFCFFAYFKVAYSEIVSPRDVTVVHNLCTKTNQLPARPSSVPQV